MSAPAVTTHAAPGAATDATTGAAPTLTLRELADEVLTLDGFLAEADGELTPEIEELLTDVTAKVEAKVEGIGRFILQETQRCAAIKEEEDRLAKRRRAIENRVRWLKDSYLREMLAKLGTDKLKGTLCTVSLQKNPPSVKGELTQERLRELHALGLAFVKLTPETFSLDRRAALDGWKADGELPVGLTVEQTQSVRIR